MNCSICLWTPDNPDYLLLSEEKYWRICLAPNQSLLGRCVIHLKRHTGDLANLTSDELLEFLDVVKKVETSTKLAFGTTMFNWSCYMNHSYRESPPNPHIHWWAVPRYDCKVEFGGLVFEDPLFGNPYDHYRVMNTPKELRLEIAEKIKNHLLSLKERIT
ncbi:MAG: HIT family protein [Anaerolineae bacterium]|nr:HIT family protein [Anaerolineae bacterium]